MKKLFCGLKNLLVLTAVGMTALLMTTQTTQAGIGINVNLNTQRMSVFVDGNHYATWKVSTGKRGHTTPTGRYRVQSMERMHYSRKYNNAPMPHSIFYSGGFAIHATDAIWRLGRVASHGCVRLHPDNAADLYALVQRNGRKSTSIHIFRGPGSFAQTYRKRPAKKHLAKRKTIRKSTRKTIKTSSRKKKIIVADNKPVFIFGGFDLID